MIVVKWPGFIAVDFKNLLPVSQHTRLKEAKLKYIDLDELFAEQRFCEPEYKTSQRGLFLRFSSMYTVTINLIHLYIPMWEVLIFVCLLFITVTASKTLCNFRGIIFISFTQTKALNLHTHTWRKITESYCSLPRRSFPSCAIWGLSFPGGWSQNAEYQILVKQTTSSLTDSLLLHSFFFNLNIKQPI